MHILNVLLLSKIPFLRPSGSLPGLYWGLDLSSKLEEGCCRSVRPLEVSEDVHPEGNCTALRGSQALEWREMQAWGPMASPAIHVSDPWQQLTEPGLDIPTRLSQSDPLACTFQMQPEPVVAGFIGCAVYNLHNWVG